MNNEVNRYLATEQGKADLEKVVNSILTPDNYYNKALQQLLKAATILEYSQYLK